MSQLTLVVVSIFIGSVATVIGLGLIIISTVLRIQRKHHKRIARVGRGRMSGRVDIEEARLKVLKQAQSKGALDTVSETLARFIPILDTTRLQAQMIRAGMSMSLGKFMLSSLFVAAMICVPIAMATEYPAPLIAGPSLFIGMFLMDAFVKLRGEMMSNKFMRQMPDGLDTIIRGIRSGLPVIECIGTVGTEAEEPIRSHFRTISESVQLGESLDSALWKVARVIDRPEMDFLAVSISIQMETGGSLAEALGNLADLLRNRQRMKLKIKAISSEAKASAMIIGALPFLMLGLLTMMNPDYVMPLFVDPRGQMMLGAGLVSITLGAIVMWRMTQFEI